MINFSQSHFLQGLGWATTNSFWQVGLLWCVFAAINRFFNLAAVDKYRMAVGSLFLGFSWFIYTLFSFASTINTASLFFENSITPSTSFLNIILIAASVTYLILLVFPAMRLFKNWQFIQVIKTQGLQKAPAEYRLFASTISARLNITKKVKLTVSELVSSPITIGYLKPLILLPVVVFNQLSPAQAEAILLHELSHIKRYDYLVNLVVTIIHTLLYFNPFVKAFMTTIEAEREACCDEMVLQFGYHKIEYASALLHLQKSAASHTVLAIAATGKHNFLSRIEKIVGVEKKRPFSFAQAVPVAAAILCILLFNSILIIKDAEHVTPFPSAYNQTVFPWPLNFSTKKSIPASAPDKATVPSTTSIASSSKPIQIEILNFSNLQNLADQSAAQGDENMQGVNFDEIEGSLTKEEKQNVENTVAATKKVVGAMEWKQIDAAIADVLTDKEKAVAKKEYFQQLSNVNWQNVERNLKAGYSNLDWNVINTNISKALVQVQLDSLQNVYKMALTEIQNLKSTLKSKRKTDLSPLPDASVDDIKMAEETLQQNLDSIKKVRPKKVIRL